MAIHGSQPPTPTSVSSASSAGSHHKRPFILVPLYIYPGPSAWDPLYAAIKAHPELDFWVVVNPANGPGRALGPLPDANYIDALVRLTAAPNVRVIGYVHCSYGARLAEEIVADYEAYRDWDAEIRKQDDTKSIIVDGIFIDETPSSTEYVQYLATLATAAKTILDRGTGGPASELDTAADAASISSSSTTTPTSVYSTAVVIYNPGVVVDPIFYQAADYIVAFENASHQWTNPYVTQGFATLPRSLASKSIIVAHSAAGGIVEVGQTSRKAADAGLLGQFVTSRPGYTEWCPSWSDFVNEMARRTLI